MRVAQRVLDAYFPPTLHADIAAVVGLELQPPMPEVCDNAAPAYGAGVKRARSARFREQVLLAYEHRCCVCGFDLRIGNVSAGLEAAHIQWHTAGGPDVTAKGLSGELKHHGQPLLRPQSPDLLPGPEFIAWNQHNVFKTPARV